jgi:hypothetical protein
MKFSMRVEMDTRNVTPWVRHCSVKLLEDGFRQFELRFSAWHHFSAVSQFDIYESFDAGSDGYESILIRRGMMSPDFEPLVDVDAGRAPFLVMQGFEYAWFARRKRPRETIVLAPATDRLQEQVSTAIADYMKKYPGRPVGQVRVWRGVRTIGDAVTRLLQAAGLRCSYRLPDHEICPHVVDPTVSYWTEMERLTDPWAPVRYYNRWTNTVVIQDATQPIMGDGPPLNIPAGEIRKLQAIPRVRPTPRRVLLRIPPWR